VSRGDKFEGRAHVGKLVGYEGRTIYRIWLPLENKIVRTTDVTFDEEDLFVQSDNVFNNFEGPDINDACNNDNDADFTSSGGDKEGEASN
jgi:hypothetical protein